MSGRDGEMSVAFDPQLGDEVTASFRFELVPGSSYAVLDEVTLRPGERRRIVVQRGGSIAVQVAPAVPGSALRARASSSRDLVDGFDVILSLKKDRRSSTRFGTSPVDGAVVWEGLEPGVYEITASALGGAASWLELASLAELVVEPGRACRDPRLLSWDPFDGHEVMALRVEGRGAATLPRSTFRSPPRVEPTRGTRIRLASGTTVGRSRSWRRRRSRRSSSSVRRG
ncbi:MAG: hypothetical protein AAGA20_00220 [Planctomycetota bacterium]